MSPNEFDNLVGQTIAEVQNKLTTKGREYSGTEDRFANFNKAAADLGLSPQQVWLAYFHKHYCSIISYIKEPKTFSDEPIAGRIVDAIAYLLLLKGIIAEQQALNPGKYIGVSSIKTKYYKCTICSCSVGLQPGEKPNLLRNYICTTHHNCKCELVPLD